MHHVALLLRLRSANYKQSSSTDDAKSLQASWDPFSDPQSGVAGYTVRFFKEVRLF